MTAIQAIETKYKGHRFRSRLEARWAVFFDAYGIAWEYEKEGYELPSGRYLPDFWLPEIRYHETLSVGVFFEIKGSHPTASEEALCFELSELTDRPTFLAVGLPPNCYIKHHGSDDPGNITEKYPCLCDVTLVRCHKCGRVKITPRIGEWLHCPVCNCSFDQFSLAIYEAGQAARSARFEHGQQPDLSDVVVYQNRNNVV